MKLPLPPDMNSSLFLAAATRSRHGSGCEAEVRLGEIRRQQERAPRIQPLWNQFVRECADRLPVPQDQSCLAVRAGRSGEHFETEVYEFLDIQVFHVGVALPEYAVL